MNPIYLNNLFCKQEIKYNLRDKTLEQPKLSIKTCGYRWFNYCGSKLWNALPVEMPNTDNYSVFKLKLTTWCHLSGLDRLEIFWCCIYSALSISRGNFLPRNSEMNPHISPTRARYGVSFVSSKFELILIVSRSCCVEIRVIFHCDIGKSIVYIHFVAFIQHLHFSTWICLFYFREIFVTCVVECILPR